MSTPTATAAAIQQQMFDALSASNLDRLRDLSHPDYTYIGPDGVEREGIEAGVAVARTYTTAFPDLNFEIRHHWTPADNVSIMEVTVRATHQGELEGIEPTGRRIEVPYCNVIETRDGKIYRERDYFDQLSLMQQLGVAT